MAISQIISIPIFVLLHCSHIFSVEALVTENIKIVGQSGGTPQFLPASYVNSFPRWSIEPQTQDVKYLSGTIRSDDEITTFVNPSSTTQLWYPSDLNGIQFRPALDILLKSGVPMYVMAGVDVRVPNSKSRDGKDWSNFGMNSRPLASQWTSFGLAVENDFRVEAFIGQKKISKVEHRGGKMSTDDEYEWNIVQKSSDEDKIKVCEDPTLAKEISVKGTIDALQMLGELIARLDENSSLINGMHILSIPVYDEWIELPKPISSNLNKIEENQLIKDETGTEFKLVDTSSSSFKLVMIATSEDDASSLLSIDEGLLDLSATSVLEVDVSLSASGSESEYLPDAYKPLYL